MYRSMPNGTSIEGNFFKSASTNFISSSLSLKSSQLFLIPIHPTLNPRFSHASTVALSISLGFVSNLLGCALAVAGKTKKQMETSNAAILHWTLIVRSQKLALNHKLHGAKSKSNCCKSTSCSPRQFFQKIEPSTYGIAE